MQIYNKVEFLNKRHRFHNLRIFPQIYAVFKGVVLGIIRILCILLKSLLLSRDVTNHPPPVETRIWKLVVRACKQKRSS